MEENSSISTEKICAVVTGANKGIGLEICRQLASNGITVILTAREDQKGAKAIENLKNSQPSLDVVFHQLDVKDPASVDSLSRFVETRFKKLDILVNNAGVSGLNIDSEAFKAFKLGGGIVTEENANVVNQFLVQTYQHAKECIETNYYGTKRVTESLLPLLQLSNSPRIVNLSSFYGELKFIHNEKVKTELEIIDSLTEGKIEEILESFLRDFDANKLKENGWPTTVSAYKVSKAAVNAYTRIVARQFSNMIVNCVHPGYVRTDITCNMGNMSPEEGARAPVMLALLPNGSPSGFYFNENNVSKF